MRSRAVCLPRECCFSTDLVGAAFSAASRRSSKSASLPAVVFGSWAGLSSRSGAVVTARHLPDHICRRQGPWARAALLRTLVRQTPT